MMVDVGWLQEVLTGWCVYGRLKVVKSCTRSVLKVFFTHPDDSDKLALQLPGHKGTVTAVDFHPKEPISTSLHLSQTAKTLNSYPTLSQFSPAAKTLPCFSAKLRLGCQYDAGYSQGRVDGGKYPFDSLRERYGFNSHQSLHRLISLN